MSKLTTTTNTTNFSMSILQQLLEFTKNNNNNILFCYNNILECHFDDGNEDHNTISNNNNINLLCMRSKFKAKIRYEDISLDVALYLSPHSITTYKWKGQSNKI